MEIKFTTKLEKLEENVSEEAKQAIAEFVIPKNEYISWTTFVLTDNLPNANSQRIPEDEFDNIINTGEYMPLKMEFGNPEGGHKNSYPLGVIAKLFKEEDETSKRVSGIAALWSKERPQDVQEIKDRISRGESVNVSWELTFLGDFVENAVRVLKNISLTAATIVGTPAYKGRTPVMSIAEETILEDDTLKDVETLTQEVSELKESLAKAERERDEAVAKIAEKETALAEANKSLEELTEFKTGVEETQKQEEKLEAIKAKFLEAKIEKPEEFFVEKKEFLLALEDSELDFMLQELATLAANTEKTEASAEIPNFSGKRRGLGSVSVTEMAEYLRTAKK